MVAALVAALLAGPTAYETPCPLLTPLAPAAEGEERFVAVGQPQPCPPGGAREDYTITTDFGDGTVAETPFRPGDGLYLIGGDHAYRRAGSYQLVATVLNRRTNQTTTYRRGPILIPNAPLTALKVSRPTFFTTSRKRRTVARFADGNRLAARGDYRVTVRWGDGTRSGGSVRKRGDGTFAVTAAHRYRTTRRRHIAITVRDDRGAELTLRTTPRIRR